MVTLFISPGCISCEKVKRWLEENNILYKERDIYVDLLSEKEFIKLLEMSENGTEEIISVRSKKFQKIRVNMESMSLQEVYKTIEEYPGMLRCPILTDNKNLVVGYNEDKIRCFIPRSVRNFELKKLLKITSIA